MSAATKTHSHTDSKAASFRHDFLRPEAPDIGSLPRLAAHARAARTAIVRPDRINPA